VLLYFHSGSLTLNQGVTMTSLRAAMSGTYAGLLYWQASNATATVNASSSFGGGSWYEPQGLLLLNQSGSHMASPQLIVLDLTVNSSSSVTVGP
jgi:hypothetical protein